MGNATKFSQIILHTSVLGSGASDFCITLQSQKAMCMCMYVCTCVCMCVCACECIQNIPMGQCNWIDGRGLWERCTYWSQFPRRLDNRPQRLNNVKSHNVLKTKHLVRKRMISSIRCGDFLVFAFIWEFGFVVGVCNFLNSVNKNLKRWTLKPLDRLCHKLSDRSVLQLRVTAQFYLENKAKYILQAWWHANPKDVKRRERERENPGPLAPLFICFSSSPGPAYVNWASQECYLFYLRSSLWSLKLPLFYCLGLFPSLPFSHHHSRLLFLIPTTQQFDGSCKKSIIFHTVPQAVRQR